MNTLGAGELPTTWPVPSSSARCRLVSEPGPAPPHPRVFHGRGAGYGLLGRSCEWLLGEPLMAAGIRPSSPGALASSIHQ